jgi:lipoate-protein ligase A
MDRARLILDDALAGPVNMARDEALLSASHLSSPITLRFYGWSPPTISLGYFQDHADYRALQAPAGSLPVVRRTTGGGAILHDLEVTYSMVIPIGHALVHAKPNHLYAAAHRAIIAAVGHGAQMIRCHQLPPCGESGQRGPFFCFARRHALDVLVPDEAGIAGYSKLAGSAQRRTTTAILQHGSIMLDCRYPQQPVATWPSLDGPIAYEEAVRRLIPCFEKELGVSLQQSEWTAGELDSATCIESKYLSDVWTLQRQRI